MRADTALDCVFFQLDPTRSRCELWVSAGGSTEKLATGSFKPFLAQLREAQEQIAKGAYSVRLQVPSPTADGSSNSALWFSKGTLQRFVRFVSTPEILERLGTLDDEYKRLEEAISILAAESIRGNEQAADKSAEIVALSGQNANLNLTSDSVNNLILSDGFEVSENTGDSSKKQLLRAMDSCRFMLLKEQQKAYTQAVAAGFDAEHMADMLVFAETFGASRLQDACLNFIALSKKNQLCRLSTLLQTESIGTADSVLVSGTGIAFNSELEDIRNPVNEHVTFVDTSNEESHSREHAANSNMARSNMPGKGSSPPPSGLRVPKAFYQSGSLISHPHISVNGLKDRAHVTRDDQQTDSLQKETLQMGYVDKLNILKAGKTNVNPVNNKTGCLSGEEEIAWTTKSRRHSLEGGIDSASALFMYSSRLPRRFLNNATSVTPESQEQQRSYKFVSANQGNFQDHPKEMQALSSGVTHSGQQADWSIKDNYVPSARNSVQQQYHQIGAETNTSESGSSTQDPFPLDEVLDCSHMHLDTSNGNSITKLPVRNIILVPDSPSQSSVPQHLPIEENLLGRNPCPENKLLSDKDGIHDSFISKHSVRRSTSPRRRSSSPLRKVHINRSPARRPVVVIKNLSYSSPNTHNQSSAHKFQYRHPAKIFKDAATGDETDSATESEEESQVRKVVNRRLSVQAAISLFENRQKDSASVQKEKLGQHDTLRKSAEPAKPVSFRKSILRKFSGSNDASAESGQLNSDPGCIEKLDSAEEKPQMYDHKQMTEVKGQNYGVSTWKSEPSRELHGIELLKQLRYESSLQLLERNMNTPQMQMVHSSVHPDVGSVTKQHAFSTISQYSDAISSPSEQEIQNDHRWSWVGSSQESDASVEKQKSEGHLGADLQAADAMKDKIVGGSGTPPLADSQRHLVLGQSDLQRLELPVNEMKDHSPGQELVKAFNAVEYGQHDELQVKSIAEELNAGWKASIDLQPEMQSYQLVIEEPKESEERTQHSSNGLVGGDSFIMSECHTGKGLLHRSWNTTSDYDMLSLLNVADSKVPQKPTEQATEENGSTGDHKGRFYEQYREKRDAKFRQESGTKRAEREAKLKAMQEVLERRKAELAARNVPPSTERQTLSEEQWRSGKLYPLRTGLTNINKKESGENLRWEDYKQHQLLRGFQDSPTTAITMQPAASTPRSLRQQTSNSTSSIARKLSPSSQKSLTTATTPRSTARSLPSSSPKSAPKNSTTPPTAQRRPSSISEPCIPDKALYRLMPSYPEPRKENTKPSSVKSCPLTQQETALSSTGTKPKVSNTSRRHKHVIAILPLESNGVMASNSILQTSAAVEDRRPKALPVRKHISTASELKATQVSVQEENILSPLKISFRDLTAEPSPQNKAYKVHMAITVPHEVKPFLRKGRGIGPGAGPGVLKLKATLAAEAAKMSDDDSLSKVDGTGSDEPETIDSSKSENAPGSMESSLDQNIHELVTYDSLVLNHEEEATAVLNKPVESLPLPASISDTEPSQESSSITGKFHQENGTLHQASKSIILPEAQHLTHDSSLAAHSVSKQAESQALFGPADSLQQPSQHMINSNYSFPLELSSSSSKSTLQQHMSINEDYPILASPSDMSLSHILSPERHSHRISIGSSSPLASPASHGFSQLRYSLSPNIDSAKAEAVQSRKRWGNSHKFSVTNSQPAPKEAPKGFKRLLKFGRKSRSSGNSNSEWVSASTTSGEDDVDESSKDLASKSSEEIIRMTASNSSHPRKTADSVSKVSDTECVTGPASRSFFSLSAFRKQRS